MFLRILSISSIRPIRPIVPLPASPFVLLPSPFLPPATPNHGQPTANFFLVVSADLGQLTAARRKGSPGFADRLLSASFEAEKIHWNTPSKEEKKKKKKPNVKKSPLKNASNVRDAGQGSVCRVSNPFILCLPTAPPHWRLQPTRTLNPRTGLDQFMPTARYLVARLSTPLIQPSPGPISDNSHSEFRVF